MKWFVNYAFSYAPINAKARELGQWVESFKHTLFPNDLSKDAFVEVARLTVILLNDKYPRTKPFVLDYNDTLVGGPIRLSFSVKGDVKTISYIDIVKVQKEFHFSEKANANALPEKKGGLR